MKRYNFRASFNEEKKNLRKAVLLVLLTLGIFVTFFFFGLPITAKFATFIGDLRKTNKPVEKQDITPPGPPHFSNYPQATSQDSLDLSGTSEPGSTVILSVNGIDQEVVAAASGNFMTSIKLIKGENTISAKAQDQSGNKSNKSETIVITYDNEAPTLEINSPTDKAEFFGDKQKKINIKGTTSPKSSLTINDRIVKVEENGSFSAIFELQEGDNSFNLKSINLAGTTTEKSLSLRFTP